MMRSRDQSVGCAEDETCSLPEDLLSDMLLRMPWQRVFEFRRLSKYYKELIDSPKFTEKHYDIRIKTRPDVFLHERRYLSRTESAVFHLDFQSAGCKVGTLKPPFEEMCEELCFLGCVRGILCYQTRVADHRHDYLIFWNPVTGVFRKSSHVAWWSTSNHTWRWKCVKYLSGYDAATDDIKVIRIMHGCIGELEEEYDCVIYSSKTDSWTRPQELTDNINDHAKTLRICMFEYGYNMCPRVFMEGTNCVHMLAIDKSAGHQIKVLAFDFRTERFSLQVPLPHNMNFEGVAGLSSLGGCLCLYRRDKQDDGVSLSAWIMKEYGVVESWEHLLSSYRLDSEPWAPLEFVDIHGRPHLMRKLKQGLFLYDVNRKQHPLFNVSCSQECELDGFQNIAATEHFLFAPTRRQP